jgi:hypothetical protein
VPAAAADDNLDALAELLIARHLRLSIQDYGKRLAIAEMYDDFPTKVVERGSRCVAIVGAGASAPLLPRAEALATALEAEFGRDETELERLELVFGLKKDAFETRLVALSRTEEAERKVRQRIAESYQWRHPTVLGYELLAHLLKHRFIDGIVSLNFDELLDQSLADELGEGEYETVISERDCSKVLRDPDTGRYQPLYVKLHGTASEPDSLRFRPEAYYALPPQMLKLASELLGGESCVVLNLGFGLGSFDVQRLLALPRRLEIFNLSFQPLADTAVERILADRQRVRTRPELPAEVIRECSGTQKTCDQLMGSLVEKVAARAEASDFLSFRSVERHHAVCRILGPDPELPPEQQLPRTREQSAEYFRRRTILELALSGAKARGLLSLGPLALDRPAHYFERYRMRRTTQGSEWSALCRAAGLVEARELPDVLVSDPRLRRNRSSDAALETEVLHEFEPQRLAAQVMSNVSPWLVEDKKAVAALARTLDQLQRQSDVELRACDDRVCSKAFRRPKVLPTETALHGYTSLVLSNLRPESRVCISSETGQWLLGRSEFFAKAAELRLIVAFDVDAQLLYERFGQRLTIKCSGPWRHNRHMTLLAQRGDPAAIYFARRLRDPIITPVYLDDIKDFNRLMTMFERQWREPEARLVPSPWAPSVHPVDVAVGALSPPAGR